MTNKINILDFEVLLYSGILGSMITVIAILFLSIELWFVSLMIGIVVSFIFYSYVISDTIEPRTSKKSLI